MGRTKGLIIDPSDICYEEECEEIGFEAPGEIKGNLVEGFSFTNEPVQFAHTAPNTKEKPKVENQSHASRYSLCQFYSRYGNQSLLPLSLW